MNWDVWPFHGAVAHWYLNLPLWAQLLLAWPFIATAAACVWVALKGLDRARADELLTADDHDACQECAWWETYGQLCERVLSRRIRPRGGAR
jgi:hypothetical protein